MSNFYDTENIDPRYVESNSNGNVKPTLKHYTNSIIQKQNQQPIHPNISASINRKPNLTPIISQARVPVINSLDPNNIKLSVKNALKHQSNRFEVGILKQNNLSKTYVKSPISPLETAKTSSSAVVTSSPGFDNKSLFEIYDHDDTQLETKSGKSIFMTNNSSPGILSKDIEQQNYLDFAYDDDGNDDDEYYEDICDPRISYLNPHKPFVDVVPLMLGKPLATNDTPLDLSSVPKLKSASPFFGFEEAELEITKDELRLYEALKYEMCFPICPINWKGENIGPPYNLNEDFEFQMDSPPKGPFFAKSSNWIGGFFQKFFKLGPFSSESKLYEKYPWAKIFYDVDNGGIKTQEVNTEENDNLDMYPSKYPVTPLDEFVDNYENLRRKKHTFVPAS